jgi:uncharacterized cupin superfamily protein
VTIAHWNEVATTRREAGHVAGTWTDLGTAAGSVTVGVRRIQVDPGCWSTPAHSEGGEEEIFYVLGGSGLSWQDGEVFEVGGGDCLVHLIGAEAHTLCAGDAGLDVLAFGQRGMLAATVLRRPGIAWLWLARTWLRTNPEPENPWRQEAALGPPELSAPEPRPPRIVNAADVPAEERHGATVGRTVRNLGRAAGSVRTGIRLYRAFPGQLAVPPHCHSAEEELFVVLEGDGTLLLGDDEHPVRLGHVVSRPAGTGVAHAFRGGENGLAFLAYGTREPNDIAYYPRSGKVFLRGIGVMGRIEALDYWDGED